MGHLVLFDGECALCNRAVRALLQADRDRHLFFAPLQGETASQLLSPPIPLDTLVLIEDFDSSSPSSFRYGKGALRILWHLSGWHRAVGFLSFLPAWIIDPFYRLIARHRHLLIRESMSSAPLEELSWGRLLP
jgi:predicted DCC family thiol-disulfide oxidoreductase YuxK